MAALKPDPWLSGLMGKECLRLELGSGPDLPDLPRGKSFVDVKVPADRTALLGPLVQAGFGLVDTQVTLTRPFTVPDLKPIPGRVRFARDGDRDAVANLAARTIRYSRFHLDPHIPDPTANRIKAAWAANFFAGKRGDAMVVANGGAGVAGFLQILRTDDRVQIYDLLAIDAAARGQGLGQSMVAFAEREADGIERLQLGTQIANTASLRFFEGLGFRVARAHYILHRHGGARP